MQDQHKNLIKIDPATLVLSLSLLVSFPLFVASLFGY
jgi:hypothetical protein